MVTTFAISTNFWTNIGQVNPGEQNVNKNICTLCFRFFSIRRKLLEKKTEFWPLAFTDNTKRNGAQTCWIRRVVGRAFRQ